MLLVFNIIGRYGPNEGRINFLNYDPLVPKKYAFAYMCFFKSRVLLGSGGAYL